MKNFIILNFIRLFGFAFKRKLKRVKLRIYSGMPSSSIKEVGFKAVRNENLIQVYRYYNPEDPIAKGSVLWRSAAITSRIIAEEVGLLRSKYFISDYLEATKPVSFVDNFYDEGFVLYELEYATPDQIQKHKDELEFDSSQALVRSRERYIQHQINWD